MIPNNNKSLNFLIVFNIILIFLSLVFFHYSNIDLSFQKYFFNFENKKWFIDKDEPIKKFIFYDFPKMIFGIVIFAGLLAFYLSFKKRFSFLKTHRKKILILLLGMTLIPLTVGNIKKFTNIYCPSELEIYNGSYPYVKIFDSYPANFIQVKKGKCFPAGHAVTGFCLMILFFIFEKKLHRILGLFLGIILGWILGFYQIAKGAHFLSDTFITMLLCFLTACIIINFFQKKYGT